MNKFLIGLLVLTAAIFSWAKLTADAQQPPATRFADDQQIILYATQWCGYCARARKYFNERNIPFVEYDVEKSREGREHFDRLNGKGVPLLVVNGEVIRGFNPDVIEQAMKKAQ